MTIKAALTSAKAAQDDTASQRGARMSQHDAPERFDFRYHGSAADVHEHRLERLIDRLPQRWGGRIRRLRHPDARWPRRAAGGLLLVGGCLFFLPVLGLWMIPLGLVLLAEDVAPLRRWRERTLHWLERRRPHWFSESHH
jgi:hypothetical protein